MTEKRLELDRATSALLVMDFQSTVVERFAANAAGLTSRVASVIAAAREADVRVLYVVVGFRPGYPEVSARNKSFSALRQSARFVPGSPEIEIHPDVAPRESEVVVTKHRVSGFFGTDLDLILRANGLETLVLTGIATSGVVLSTLRHAADADYACVVASDGCADADPEVHRMLLEKVFPRQAEVVTCADVVAALRCAPDRRARADSAAERR